MKVPAGLDSPNTAGALVIPTVEVAPPPPGPNDACYDVPPRYKAAPTNKAGEVASVAAPAAAASAAAPGPITSGAPEPSRLGGAWEFRMGPIYGFSQNIDSSSGSADIKSIAGIKTGVAYYLTDHLSVARRFHRGSRLRYACGRAQR